VPTLTTSYFFNNIRTTDFIIPDLSPGTYPFRIEVIDEFGNYGIETHDITIPQILTDIDVTTTDAAVPEERIYYTIEMFDQEGDKIQGIVSVTIEKTNEIISFTTHNYTIPKHTAPGNITITASSGEMTETAYIEILKTPKFTFETSNNTVIISNEGNVALDKFIFSYDKFIFSYSNLVNQTITEKILPGKEKKFDVSKTTAGRYNLTINGQGPKEITIVETGTEFPLYILIIIILGIILFKFKNSFKKPQFIKKKGKSLNDIFMIHYDHNVMRHFHGVRVLNGDLKMKAVVSGRTNITTFRKTDKAWVVMNFLNIFFERLVDICRKNNSLINSKITEEVLIFSHSPLEALKVIFETLKEIEKLNVTLEKELVPKLQGSFALHYSEVKMNAQEYEKDDIAVVRKLQENVEPGQVLITEEVLKEVKDHVLVIPFAKMEIHGKAFAIYSVSELK